MFDKWGHDGDIALGHTSVLPKAYLGFAGVAVMNDHKLRTLFSHSPGGQQSVIKVSGGPRYSLVYDCIILTSASIFSVCLKPLCLSLRRTPVFGFRALNPG